MTVTIERVKPLSIPAGQETVDWETAFDALFREHWPRVYGVLFRLVGDLAEAEDLALEVFWRLYQRPPPTNEKPAGWLYRVSTNLGFNALRARKRREHYEQQAGKAALEFDATSDPATEVERRAERHLVRSVLSRMKPRSAQMLVLRAVGLSYAEISAALNIAPGSVGTLLARAEREFEQQYRKGGS